MRRAHGPRTPITLQTYELLAQLYTSTAKTYYDNPDRDNSGSLAREYSRKALRTHEDILQMLIFENGTGDDSDDELDAAAEMLAKHGSRSPNMPRSPNLRFDGNVTARTPPSPNTPLDSAGFAALAKEH